MSEKHEQAKKGRFAMTPRMVLRDKSIGTTAKLLYTYYKDICCDDGECFKTAKTISEESGIPARMIKKYRDELERHGYINVDKSRHSTKRGNPIVVVTIVPIWDDNLKYCENASEANDTKVQQGEGANNTKVQQAHYTEVQSKKSNEKKSNNIEDRLSPADACDRPKAKGFFSSSEERRQGKQSSQSEARQLSDKLYDALEKYGYITARHRINRKYKQDPISKLMAKFNLSFEEVDSVLGWYIENIHDKYTPSAHSATAFADKFFRIKKVMSISEDGFGSSRKSSKPDWLVALEKEVAEEEQQETLNV